jgi:HEAT repeat protein
LKAGVIGSLGVRGDGDSVPALAKLLGDDDATVACAAACALGAIRSPQAVQALAQSKPTAPEAKRAAVDASFACAERLLADGKKTEALALYKQFAGEDRPKHVRLAATRGMLACAGSAQ